MELRRRKEEAVIGTTSNPCVRDWNFLCHLKIPGKIKHFLWRLLHKALPRMAELKRRRISEGDNCVVYQLKELLRHISIFFGIVILHEYIETFLIFQLQAYIFRQRMIWDWIAGIRIRIWMQETSNLW